VFQFIPKVFDGVEVRALCRPVKFFQTSLDKHYSSSTKRYSWLYAFRQVAFSRHPPNPDLSVGLPDDEERFITPGYMFQLLQSPMALSFKPLQQTLGIAHGDVRLVCGCSAIETHFMKLLTNSCCADVASRDSLEVSSVVTEDR
jgi:hypothetical protein